MCRRDHLAKSCKRQRAELRVKNTTEPLDPRRRRGGQRRRRLGRLFVGRRIGHETCLQSLMSTAEFPQPCEEPQADRPTCGKDDESRSYYKLIVRHRRSVDPVQEWGEGQRRPTGGLEPASHFLGGQFNMLLISMQIAHLGITGTMQTGQRLRWSAIRRRKAPPPYESCSSPLGGQSAPVLTAAKWAPWSIFAVDQKKTTGASALPSTNTYHPFKRFLSAARALNRNKRNVPTSRLTNREPWRPFKLRSNQRTAPLPKTSLMCRIWHASSRYFASSTSLFFSHNKPFDCAASLRST